MDCGSGEDCLTEVFESIFVGGWFLSVDECYFFHLIEELIATS